MEYELIEILLAAAIRDTEMIAATPLTREVIQAYLKEYADDFEALKASINYLPVPLEIMHSANVCAYFGLYCLFEELNRLYDVAATCQEALEAYRKILAQKEQRNSLKHWFAKYQHVNVEAVFIPERKEDSPYIVFSKSCLDIRVLYNEYRPIFDLHKLYFEEVKKAGIPTDLITTPEWEN